MRILISENLNKHIILYRVIKRGYDWFHISEKIAYNMYGPGVSFGTSKEGLSEYIADLEEEKREYEIVAVKLDQNANIRNLDQRVKESALIEYIKAKVIKMPRHIIDYIDKIKKYDFMFNIKNEDEDVIEYDDLWFEYDDKNNKSLMIDLVYNKADENFILYTGEETRKFKRNEIDKMQNYIIRIIREGFYKFYDFEVNDYLEYITSSSKISDIFNSYANLYSYLYSTLKDIRQVTDVFLRHGIDGFKVKGLDGIQYEILNRNVLERIKV